MTPTKLDAARATYRNIAGNISKIIRGQDSATRHLLAQWRRADTFCWRIIPAQARPRSPRALAKSIDAQFKRLQFTPDLLPSDILGVSIFDQRDQQFHFHEGPVFTKHPARGRNQPCLAAHAIGPARSDGRRSGERRGRTADLSELFFVIATENPVEFRGTYPLPEAQMDRFAMQFTLGYVSPEEEVAILTAQEHNHPLD